MILAVSGCEDNMTIYFYSRLRCYEQCPQKYKFRYIDKVKMETKENVGLFLGRRVHETLKKLYCDIQYPKGNALEDILAFLHYRWAIIVGMTQLLSLKKDMDPKIT